MKNKIIMIFCFIFLCGVLCAAGSTETSTKGDKGSDEKMAGYDTSAQVPRRTVVGNIVVLDMLDVLDVDVVALPTTRRKIDPKHQNKPRIGNPMNPDIEQLKSVDPDLFVTTGDPNSSFGEQLKAAGIPAAFLKTSTYNDFWFSQTIDNVKAAGMKNAIEALPENERYTYVYDGHSQTLDNILVTGNIAIIYADVLHLNSEFSPKKRVSDHDPVFVQLRF